MGYIAGYNDVYQMQNLHDWTQMGVCAFAFMWNERLYFQSIFCGGKLYFLHLKEV